MTPPRSPVTVPRPAGSGPRALRFHGCLAAVLLAFLVGVRPAFAQVVRGFTPRFTTNERGDITLVGNTLMSCSGSGQCNRARSGIGGQTNNNDHNMQYVDVDGDPGTFCSSAALLSLPPGATVLWAGLYWGGFSASAARGQVLFSTPAAAGLVLAASQLDASGSAYQGFRDVTAEVAAGGNGTYLVANVQSTTGTNRYAGWSLVVAYRLGTLPIRNIVAFDGYAQVAPGATVTIPVSGFVTPPGGVVNTRLGVVAYEGDLGYTGDSFSLNGVALGNASNPASNFFNSSISQFGAAFTSKAPNYENQLGFDADLLALVDALPNGATSASIALSSVGDRYYPGAVTFTTDLYAPVISGDSFRKTVTDLNGPPARPGDILEYAITMINSGDDDAVQTVLADTLPANAVYVPGSIEVMTGANAGAKSDATGDDQAEYEAALRRVVARLGTGADAMNGGSLPPGAATSLRFRVTIGSPSPNGSTVANQAGLAFEGRQTGTAFRSQSDGDSTVAGAQPTVVAVTAPRIAGRVFEDVAYGGGAGRTRVASGGMARPGARVELYDAAGVFLAAETTDALGGYAFDGWAPGDYTVRVVNASVISSRPGAVAGLLPVQTFRTDAVSGTAMAVLDHVGGEIPSSEDAPANTGVQTLASLTTGSSTAQSIAPVALGAAGVSGVDFGFSFDVVVNANDAGQGSLRQFLLNANALGNAGLAQAGQSPGIETSIFMVSDGAAHPGLRPGLANLLTGGVVTITVQTPLPPLADPGTRVDGTTQTVNVGDTNPGTLGTAGTVGTDAVPLPAVPRPEVEIRDGAGLALGFDVQGAGAALAGLAVWGFGSLPGDAGHANVRVGPVASSMVLERCVLGSGAAAFADPGPGMRSGGDNLRAVGGDGGTIRNCLVGFAAGSGIALTEGSDTWRVVECEIRGNAIGHGVRDGLTWEASGSATVRACLVVGHEGPGVDARDGIGGTVFENVTVAGNGGGSGSGVETPGVRLGGTAHRLDRCVITVNAGAGVLLVPGASATTLTRNSIFANGGGAGGQIGIDLLASGEDEATGSSPFVTRNDAGDADAGANGLVNFPVLESAVLANGSFTLTGWARPGSVIEVFVAEPDPSGFGEGRTWVGTYTEGSAADLDAGTSPYAGPVNGLDQGSDDTNRFRFTAAAPAGVAPGAALTATATLSAATSEFSGRVVVSGGVVVAGAVYSDADHDFQRDAGEAGCGLPLFVKLVSEAAPLAAQGVATVDAVTGDYAFTFVPAGTYSIVLDDNPSAVDVTPTPPAGWIVTEAAPGLRAGLSVGAASMGGQDIGLFSGSRVEGRVFRDDGAAAGVANDGVRQAGEAGIAAARLRIEAAACGGVCDSALTGAGGDYALWLPAAAVGEVQMTETDPAGWISTGGSAGTSGGAYSRAEDTILFLAGSGMVYTGLDFGDVPSNVLVPSGDRVGPPGGVVFHAHTFTAGSAGTVTFTLTRSPAPPIPGWSADLSLDSDCDGLPDPGEPAAVSPVAVGAGQTLCLVLRHTIPAAAPDGARESITLDAGFDYLHAVPALASFVRTGDVTTVAKGGGLEIVKSVDAATAKPGDALEYTITYHNLGADPLQSIVIQDATPAFTVFESAGCGILGAGLGGCSVTAAPAAGGTGGVTWTLAGALAPGASGTVTFRVRVQ